MMRFLTLIIVLLFVIQRTFADNCICSCCISNGCTPQIVAVRDVGICGSTICTPQKCIQWYYNQCLPPDGLGNAKAECESASGSFNGSKRLLSSLSIVFGITSIILMIKNKF